MSEACHDPAAVLAAAAFGGEPGRWPLPSATTSRQRWLRAVAAGGQGRYASAATDLAALLRDTPAGPAASLAYSTRASFLRQLGGHDLARGLDGRALALARSGDEIDPEAGADALVGLAADALGVGRFAASAALLARARQLPQPPGAPARPAIRREWVTAELAMVTGDGATAVRHAEQALQATPPTMARHRVKSQVVLAGALCCAGSLERARAVAETAFGDAGRLGLVPLRWALACLLIDLNDTAAATLSVEELRAVRDDAAELVRCRGGSWQVRRAQR